MKKIIYVVLLLSSVVIYSQETSIIIGKFGKVYPTEKPGSSFETDKEYKIIFDVFTDWSTEDESNPKLQSIIDYLNRSSEQGVSEENMKVAVIFHGTATKNVLNNKAYQRIFNTDNPNTALIEKLREAQVELYVDRKSYFGNVYELEDKASNIRMAYSALAALMRYEKDGYLIVNSY